MNPADVQEEALNLAVEQRMIRAEFEDLMQLSIEAGTIKHPIAYETYTDERFVRAQKTATIPL